MFGLFVLVFASLSLGLLGTRLTGRTVKNPRRVLAASLFVCSASLLAGGFLALFAGSAAAAEAGAALGAGAGMGFIGAAVSTGLACLGAGIAVAVVGAAALGIIGEKPEMLGTTLIYLGLAEGIAIYGVIVALLILGKL
jgi:V/A-type H+-transporting ATPase subunit K